MDEQDVSAPTTLRDALEASFDQAEQSASQTTSAVPDSPSDPVEVASAKTRDEIGRFASPDKSPVATTHDIPEEPLVRPTTWKKEYLPLWDKMQSGQALTQEENIKFLRYASQRESEYKTGVSTYKGEAENARVLQEAIAPFTADLQKHGIHPAAWINNLGRAHQTLSLGNDQQRLDAFIKLAADYRVPLQSLLGGEQPDQATMLHLEEMNRLKQQVDNLSSWTENEKNSRLQSEIDRVRLNTAEFPHFEQVRGTMAQLLESGLAPDLENAYAKAVRMQDDVWQIEQERLLNNARAESTKSLQVAKAKAAAVSIRSASPSSTTVSSGAKDRRSVMEEAFNQHAGGRV